MTSLRDTLSTLSSPSDWETFFQRYFELTEASDYYRGHLKRYVETACWIPQAGSSDARVLEIGATPVFQELLRNKFGFEEVHGTDFEASDLGKNYYRQLNVISERPWYMTHFVNVEEEPLPLDDNYLDLVILCEVIEHMEVDPMYLMCEINRVLRPGGRVLLTTPNSASGRIVWSVLSGYRPHFFMQYKKDRGLYKHNFEHDSYTVTKMLEGAGFSIEKLSTIDCFAPQVPEAIKLLAENGFPTEGRGDNIFALAKKVGAVKDRYPDGVYA